MNIKIIKVENIDNFIFLKKFIFPEEIKNLEKSIKENGVVYPIKCIKKENKFFILDGIKRLYIAKFLNIKEIPSLIENYYSEKICFIRHLKLNLHRNFNQIEISNLLQTAINYFKDEYLANYLLLKTLGKTSKKLIKGYESLNNLTDIGKIMLIKNKLNLIVALEISKLNETAQKKFLNLFQNLKLNSNKQKKAFEYFFDLSKRFNKKMEDLLEEFSEFYKEEYSKNLENKFFDKLEKLHSPDYYEYHKNFLKIKNSVTKNLKGINILSPSNYEDEIFKAEIFFKDFEELQEKIKKLSNNLEKFTHQLL